ncbi:MaoC/PaaZ C-terminal domain-containing protein [Paenarthrobacter sp. YIM B13468]|uniref:MaoC/PaaZ C-terminal domain-containing protein n=1 Tax=Paenarthrobacter sp. YIM B13468 TaxID=3366295 RepID=UPI00366FB366
MTTNLLGTTNESAVRYLEELDLGQQWTSAGRTVTEFDVVTFATWSGDMHPLHTNEEYAKTTQFGTRVFHGPGALSLAFGLEMALGWKNGSAIAFLGIDNWILRAPIFIGDTMSVREEVIGIKPSASKPDRGVVTTRVQILNQDGVICQEGDWIVLLSRRPV